MDTLQLPFSFALPTEIIYGPGCLQKLPETLARTGGKRPLLITDKGCERAGLVEKATALLGAAGIPYAVFDGVEPNPKDINVRDGARAARAHKADCLIALGGGSPIDCAKAVGVLLAHDAEDIKRYEGKTAATLPNPPLISIPTTAGTGSELTFSAVITDTTNHYKMTVKSPYTAATVALCDPALTRSVPAPVTAATGVDALTHAIEAFTATCAEPLSDAAALYAIELICPNLPKAVKDGDDMQARSAMLLGSMLAGIAFSHADVGSVHCIAESLGGLYDLPHGVCNAVFLPYVMEYSLPFAQARYARIARAMGVDGGGSAEADARAAVAAVQALCREVGLPSFASFGVKESDFDTICEMSSRNISTMSNPRPMEAADYRKVLEAALRG